MPVKFTQDEEQFLQDVFRAALPEDKRAAQDSSCGCSGCSCPSGSGDICDAGTYVGYAGGYYGSATA